jgi:hypothetical protein
MPFLSTDNLLNTSILGRIRRNHGLEHATLTILSRSHPGAPMAGHSTINGFRLIANFPTQDVRVGVQEALSRLKAGERTLAFHPNCGTSFVTSGTLAGLAGALAMLGVGSRKRDKLERLPLAASLATLALILAGPLGAFLQVRLTTSGDPGALEVVDITRIQRGRLIMHQITTRG